MKSKYLIRVSISVLALLVVGLIVLMRLPVVSLVAWDEYQIEATDIDRSTLLSGDMYLEIGQLPTLDLVQASWQWCPSLQPLSWCLQLQGTDFEFNGMVSFGPSSVRIEEAEIQLDSLAPAGIDPTFAGLHALIYIDELAVSDLGCPVGSLEALTANAEIADITLLGSSMGEASLVATANQRLLEAVLTGDQMSGRLDSLNSEDYSGSLTIYAPPELESLFSQFAEPGEAGEYQWSLSGRWPCGGN